MVFALGFACGVIVCGVSCFGSVYAASRYEWHKRMCIERDVKKLMRKLACGQGYVGCTGGPNCSSDHK